MNSFATASSRSDLPTRSLQDGSEPDSSFDGRFPGDRRDFRPSYVPLSPLQSETPLVSIIMFCRNRANLISRAVESICQQTYPHWELVIQDGASTDGTKEIIESYRDPRIKLISAPDAGPFDAMWKAYHRCQGEITGSCLSDEELLPHALAEGVQYFHCHPQAAALIRDLNLVQVDGSIIRRYDCSEYNFLDYLSTSSALALQTVLFRREALLDIGLKTRPWRINCADFELLTLLGRSHRIDCYPGVVGHYCQHHPGQLSTNPEIGYFCTEGHLRFIHDYLIEQASIRQLHTYTLTLAYEAIRRLYVLKEASPEIIGKLEALFQSLQDDRPVDPLKKAQQALSIGKLFLADKFLEDIPSSDVRFNRSVKYTYIQLLDCFAEQEQVLNYWASLASEGVPGAAESFLSTQLRTPGSDAIRILAFQKRWSTSLPRKQFLPTIIGRSVEPSPIKLAFHAGDWETTELKLQLLPLLRHFASDKWSVFCYTSAPTNPALFPPNVHVVSLTRPSLVDFHRQVGADQIEVLIELSDLRPGHQFAALANRCAPVQIVYLGLMSTTGLREVDYQITDTTLCPPALQKFHTEKPLHLPSGYGCFNFPFSSSENKNRKIHRIDPRFTFGCLASSLLLNKLVLDAWARLLVIAPDTRLLIANPDLDSSDARVFLRHFFKHYEIDRERLHFIPRWPGVAEMDVTDQIDLYLDTFPQNDPIGVACALSRGIPAVTLLGSTMAGRASGSILQRIGLKNCIAQTVEEYASIATALARRPEDLARWKTALPRQMAEQKLTDIPAFAAEFQQILLRELGR